MNNSSKYKVYEIRRGLHHELWCATTAIEALRESMRRNRCTLDELSSDDDIVLIPQERWADMRVVIIKNKTFINNVQEYINTADSCQMIYRSFIGWI